jgi:hypothetical protein
MNYKQKTISVIIPVFLLFFAGISCAKKVDSQPDNKVPDSEMYHIVFSLDWLLANDAEPGPSTVNITFPESWLDDSPEIRSDDSPVYLDIPKKLLNDNNSSNDPDFVTVVFPNRYFEGIPEQQAQVSVSTPQLFIDPPELHFYTRPGENPPDEIIRLYSRYGPVDWTLTAEIPWFTLSQSKGTARSLAEQPRTTVTIGIGISNLKAGTYTTTLMLTAEQISYRREIPVDVFITEARAGQILDIPVNAKLDDISQDINLEADEIKYASLERNVESMQGPNDIFYSTGDMCILVTGKVKNETDQGVSVNLRAEGHDMNGNTTSWSVQVDPYPIPGAGISIIDIPPRSIADFKLYLSFAENVAVINILASD